MHKAILAAALTFTCVAPALAAANANNTHRETRSWIRAKQSIAAPSIVVPTKTGCDSPYIGDWKHGYPGTIRC